MNFGETLFLELGSFFLLGIVICLVKFSWFSFCFIFRLASELALVRRLGERFMPCRDGKQKYSMYYIIFFWPGYRATFSVQRV